MRRLIPLALIVPVLFTLAAAACSDDVSTTAPTDTTPAATTDSFSGTITPNGAATHTFTVARSGSVIVTLVSLGPDNTVTIGFGLGTWNGATCQVVIARDTAAMGNNILGTVTASGLLCVRLYDVGFLTEPATYEVQVVHP